jgi:hypothetical protein
MFPAREREKRKRVFAKKLLYICADTHMHKRLIMLSNLTRGIYLGLILVAFKFDVSCFDSQLQNHLEKIW